MREEGGKTSGRGGDFVRERERERAERGGKGSWAPPVASHFSAKSI